MVKRKDGRWQECIYTNGIPKYYYGKTKAELLEKLRRHKERESGGMPFAEVADLWWSEIYEEIEYNTAKSYRPALVRAVERFGERRIADIAPREISLMLRTMGKQYADKTVRTQRIILNGICTYAVEHGMLNANPVRDVSVPDGLRKQKRTTPPSSDIAAVKASVRLPFGLFPMIALYTGMRKGEILALTWQDVDLQARTISVNKSLYHVANSPTIKKPKTAESEGVVPILDALLPHLVAVKKKSGKLFPAANGGYLSETQFKRLWDDYRAAAGITSTPHQFRHAFATMLFEAGVPPQDAQHLLRHRQISTTMDVYTDLREEKRKQIHASVYTIDIA